ncbi:PepSY-associated TM helix domain-containing protein [Mucilaginibacter phyllosphaerae]
MTSFKKGILFIHRWLGFISGLVVFIVSITGAIYAFQDEIQDGLFSYRKVIVSTAPMLPPSRLQALAELKYPKGKVTSVLYFGSDRSVQVRVTAKKVVHSLFFNPYSGEFLKDQDFKNTFFNQVKSIHLNCFFPPEIGSWVVSISVSIFVILLITGIVLWWPKRRTDRKRSFTIKWKGKWRRVNYDLHNVLGFYAFSVSLLLAVSGLAMSYHWLGNGISNALNGGKKYAAEQKKFKSDTLHNGSSLKAASVLDSAYMIVRKRSPKAEMMIIIPGAKASSPLSITAYPQSLHFGFNDGYNFDKHNGKLLKYLPYEQKSAGLKYSNMNYDIHVGQVAGLPGKIAAFLATLISASLPLSGLIIYLGKRNNKNRRGKKRRRLPLTSS